MAGSKWGLELGALKTTHDATIVSLLRYALTVVGSTAPPDLFAKLNTQITSIATRQIGGVRRSAKIESLHFVVGTHALRNLFVVHCADFLDFCLRAAYS